MRTLVLGIFAAACLAPAARAHADGNAPPLGHSEVRLAPDAKTAAALRRHRDRLRGSPRPGRLLPTKPIPLSAAAEVELVSIIGSLTFDTSAGTFSNAASLTLKALTDVGEVYLYLPETLSGTMQIADSQGALTTTDVGSGVYGVTLRSTLTTGQSVTLSVSQGGKPQCQSSFLGLVVCQVSSSLTYALGGWQPMVYDYTSGQVLKPTAGATFQIKVPASWVAGATAIPGTVVTNPDGTKTQTYSNSFGGDLSFGAAAYATGTTSFDSTKTTSTYLTPVNASLGASWRQATVDVMAFHAARYGAYDAPKIDIVEVPDIAGAAYGPFLAIFMPSTLMGYAPTHWSTRMTLAHELGHQWFAGLIEAADSMSPWLNEGFATFAEMEYTSSLASKEYKTDFGPSYRRLQNQEYMYTVLGEQDVPISSAQIYQVPTEVYVVLTYNKGGLVVGMLRYLLGGEAAFLSAIKSYRADHTGKTADVKSLKKSLETASGKDLNRFFNAWVYGAGYPTFQVAVKRGGGAAGPYATEVTVTSDKDWGLPLELEVTSADGKVETKTLPLPSASSTSFSYTAKGSAEILSVRLDPQKQVAGRVVGKLAGDVHLNGEVDGVDLIYAAHAYGQQYDPQSAWTKSFADWADLSFDGDIDQKDLAVVLGSFGKRTGE